MFQRLQRKERDGEKQRDAIMAARKQAMAGIFASSIAHDLNKILTLSQFAIERLSQNKERKASDRVHVDNLQSVNNQIHNYAKRLADVSGKHLSSEIHKTDVVSTVAVALKLATTHKTVKQSSTKSDLHDET